LADATHLPRHTGIEPERFWIDTGCYGTIKKRETFVLETIEKRLGNDQSWSLVRPGQASKKTHPVIMTSWRSGRGRSTLASAMHACLLSAPDVASSY